MSPVRSIILFAFLFLLGNLLLVGAIMGLAVVHDLDPQDLLETISTDPVGLDPGILRSVLWIQTTLLFIIPGIIFGLIAYGKGLLSGFRLQRSPTVYLSLLGILLLTTGYPLVTLAYEINSTIPMPEWAGQMEDTAAGLLAEVLAMDTPLKFISTLMIVAVLPAIGEELVFRGILQEQFGRLFKNGHLAVWTAAVIFSAVHFQFEGFLPRMVLGAIIGYLYLWTRNLWVPIIAHLFNNGIQVGVLYFTGVDLQAVETSGEQSMSPWMYVVGTLAFLVVAFLINISASNAKE